MLQAKIQRTTRILTIQLEEEVEEESLQKRGKRAAAKYLEMRKFNVIIQSYFL